MTKDEIIKALRDMAKYPTVTLPRDCEALRMAADLLAQPEHGWTPERIAGIARLKDAQDKRLAQPEQEPVGQLLENAFGRGQVMWFNKPKDESMLYTTPPQRKPLTDEEFRAILRSLSRQQGWDGDGWDLALKEAIEAAHGIKGEA